MFYSISWILVKEKSQITVLIIKLWRLFCNLLIYYKTLLFLTINNITSCPSRNTISIYKLPALIKEITIINNIQLWLANKVTLFQLECFILRKFCRKRRQSITSKLRRQVEASCVYSADSPWTIWSKFFVPTGCPRCDRSRPACSLAGFGSNVTDSSYGWICAYFRQVKYLALLSS